MRASLHWIMPLGFAALFALAGCSEDEGTSGGGGSTSSGTGGNTTSGTGGTGGSSSGTGGTGGSSSGTGGTGGSSSGTGGTGGSSSGTGGTGGTGGSCVAPDVPSTPVPADAATGVDPDATTSVSWADSTGADSYDVYFGDTCPPPAYPDAAFQTVNAATLTGLTLAINSSYCWQVVAVAADPSCYAEGPVWGFDSGCNDAVAGAPDVTSGDAVYQPGTTAGTYPLTFSEDVYNVAGNVTWTPVVGTGTMDAVNQVDGQNYDVDFSGVADGDLYTLTVDTGVTDFCGNAVVAQVDIAISILDSGLTCTQATDLTFQSFPFTLIGTFDDDPAEGGSCDTTPTNAVWYTYTAPSDGWYEIAALNNTGTNAYSRLAVFEDTGCSPLGTELLCNTAAADNITRNVYLSQGQSYLILFHTDGDSYTMVDPEITITGPLSTAAGDDCAGAIDVTGQTFPYLVTGTFDYELGAGGSCDTSPNNMVWFSYTAPNTAYYSIDLTNTGGSGGSSRVAIYEGATCNPLGTQLDCSTATGTAVATAVQLTQGETYTIAFYTSGETYAMIDPQIDIAEITFAPGEECGDAIDLTSATFPYQVTGTFDYELSPGGSCDTSPTNMVWFSYTPSTTDLYDITAVNNTSTNAYSRVAVFEGASCNPLGTEIDCTTASSKTVVTSGVPLTQGVTYLIVFYTDGNTYTMVDPEITIEVTPPPATGQLCSVPADLSAATFPYQLIGTFDDDGTGGTCDATATNIVWYTYTPTVTQAYTISAVNYTSTAAWSRLAVFETASCNPYGTQIGCITSTNKTPSTTVTLTAGVTYLIMFYTDGNTYTMIDPEITITP